MVSYIPVEKAKPIYYTWLIYTYYSIHVNDIHVYTVYGNIPMLDDLIPNCFMVPFQFFLREIPSWWLNPLFETSVEVPMSDGYYPMSAG